MSAWVRRLFGGSSEGSSTVGFESSDNNSDQISKNDNGSSTIMLESSDDTSDQIIEHDNDESRDMLESSDDKSDQIVESDPAAISSPTNNYGHLFGKRAREDSRLDEQLREIEAEREQELAEYGEESEESEHGEDEDEVQIAIMNRELDRVKRVRNKEVEGEPAAGTYEWAQKMQDYKELVVKDGKKVEVMREKVICDFYSSVFTVKDLEIIKQAYPAAKFTLLNQTRLTQAFATVVRPNINLNQLVYLRGSYKALHCKANVGKEPAWRAEKGDERQKYILIVALADCTEQMSGIEITLDTRSKTVEPLSFTLLENEGILFDATRVAWRQTQGLVERSPLVYVEFTRQETKQKKNEVGAASSSAQGSVSRGS